MSIEQMIQILPQQLVFGIALGSVYALVALGYTMVYGILFMINFAHGDVFMVGSFVGWAVLSVMLTSGIIPINAALIILLMMIVAASVCAILGMSVEFFAYRPLYARGTSRLGPLISAIGASIFIQNTVMVTQGARQKVLPTDTLFPNMGVFTLGSANITTLVVLIVVTCVIAMWALDHFVRTTRLGRGMRAVRENRQVAQMMGVNINQVVSLTFLIGSAIAGIGGVLVGLYYTQIDFYVGWYAGLKAFTAAVLGGIGNLRGAMLGGLALGVIESLGIAVLSVTGPATGFGVAYKDLIAFAVLILVLVIRPTGILGEEVAERF